VSEEHARASWVEQVMGRPVSLLARGAVAGPAVPAAVEAVFAELRRVDELLSPYREDSEVSRIARGERFRRHRDTREVAGLAERARELTGGLFDATRPDGRWDPSGLVKGWAVERAARHLDVVGVDWCLNAGGDVAVSSRSGAPFVVGIEDPADPSTLLATVPSSGLAVATSGTAARGRHLYDPRSGAAADELASVTVVGPSLTWADVLATAAFVAGQAALDLVARLPGYTALVVRRDGTTASSPGWPGTLLR
jgi:thiamine biosynthesis lipoprotein